MFQLEDFSIGIVHVKLKSLNIIGLPNDVNGRHLVQCSQIKKKENENKEVKRINFGAIFLKSVPEVPVGRSG